MLVRTLALCTLAFSATYAYTEADREEALKEVDSYGFPRLAAFAKMTPKQLKTVMKTYLPLMGEGAFEYFSGQQIEVIFAAVSAANNCEMCLSFHAMAMGDEKLKNDPADIKEIVAGGLPKDPEMRKLVIAAKYALAHKGVLLPREKLHLASMGIDGEKFMELNFLVGMMSAHNQNYIYILSEGLELEPFLQDVGPFADTVYKKKDEL